jgi:hypothetical protein
MPDINDRLKIFSIIYLLVEGTSSSSNQNKSKIIEERLEWAKQRAKQNLDMYLYSTTLEELYNLVRKKAPEVLPELEKLVKETGTDIFDTRLLSSIGDYIEMEVPPKGVSDKIDNIYRKKINNLEKGLEKLLNSDVKNFLFKLYKDISSGKYIPPDFNLYLEEEKDFARCIGERLNWRTLRMYAREKAARNYLYFHIKCLLSNPEEYIQNMKTSNLDAFIREPCKYTYNWI